MIGDVCQNGCSVNMHAYFLVSESHVVDWICERRPHWSEFPFGLMFGEVPGTISVRKATVFCSFCLLRLHQGGEGSMSQVHDKGRRGVPGSSTVKIQWVAPFWLWEEVPFSGARLQVSP